MASQFLSSWPDAGAPSLTQAFRMSVRSSSVASRSRDVSSLTLSPSSRRMSLRRARSPSSRAEAREGGFGVGHDAVDQLPRGDDLADEPGGLAAGGVAIVDVAVLARPDSRGEPHALGLEGEGEDVGGALLPLAGEVVPDRAARLARRAPVHDGALLVD